MEELIKLVSKQTGVSNDTATNSVAMVAGFLQGQLPSAVGGQVDDALGVKPSTAAKKAKSTEDLVKLISAKTGIPEQTAEKVLEVVLGYLKKNLPAPLAGAVDALLSGAGGAGLADLLGGMLGQ
jgi:NACalpha-BTF3-like transcription factor